MGKSGFLGNWEIVNKISEEVKAKLDADVQDILNSCLMEVTALLKKEEPLMDRLAQELVDKSELNYDEITGEETSFAGINLILKEEMYV